MTNVVLVHTDDTGRYIDPYGHAIGTDNLSRMADEGLLFRNAFCSGPTCSPSRSSVMTGRCPHSNGMLGLSHRGFSLNHPERHLATYLSEGGVETVLAGQQHEASGGEDAQTAAREILGYDRVLSPATDALESLTIDGNDQSRTDRANAIAAAQFLRERSPSDQPFFLSVGLYNTHQPMPLEQTVVDPDRVAPPAPLPDVPAVRREMAAYHVLAQAVDQCVGELHQALAETGLDEETLFVFTTDHGIPFPMMKCDLRDDGIGVALIARFPDGRRAGTVEDGLVSTMDLYPTICEFMGQSIPEWVQAPSLLPLTTGAEDSVREAIHSEVTYHAAYEPKRCVRTNRYKYIRRFDPEHPREVGANTDRGPSKAYLMDKGFLERPRPERALYDLEFDPHERNNLVDDPAHQDVREAMERRLEEWMVETEDPLLDGPVSKPPGAYADRRDALHPDDGQQEPADAR